MPQYRSDSIVCEYALYVVLQIIVNNVLNCRRCVSYKSVLYCDRTSPVI